MKKLDEEKIKKLEKLVKALSKDIKALKRPDEKLSKIKFVNVLFDQEKYKEGEENVNNALNDGYELSRHFQTESGVVICLGKFKPKNKKASEMTSLTTKQRSINAKKYWHNSPKLRAKMRPETRKRYLERNE